jgi:hypothetical protein
MATIELLPRQVRFGEFPFANAGGELIMTAGMRFDHTVLAPRLIANSQFLSRSELFRLEMAD